MIFQALPVNEALTLCRLPVRPSPELGEAAIGYLQRVAEVNGYTTSRLLWHGLETWENLATALDIGIHGNPGLVGSLPANWHCNAELKSEWGKADFNHSHLRWCPLCLMDSAHVRGIWLLKLCCVCTEHKIVLHERCQNCGNQQDLPHLRLGACCVCGRRLTQGNIQPVSATVLRVSHAMLSRHTFDAYSEGLPPLSARQWARLFVYLGQYTETGQPDKPGKVSNLHQLDVSIGLLDNLALLLTHWPDNFHRILKAIQQRETQSTSLKKTFGKLINVLYRQLPGPDYKFLRDSFERYLTLHWQGQLCKRHRLFKAKTINSHPRLTIPQAARLTGSPPSLVSQWLDTGNLSGFRRFTAKQRCFRTISRQQLWPMAALTKGSLTLGQAAQRLCLSERRLRMLISEGVVKPLVSRGQRQLGKWHIPGHEVNRLWFRPEAIISEETETLGLRAILRHDQLSDSEFIGLANALIAHTIKPFSVTPDSIPLGKVQLDKNQFKEWRKNYREITEIEISVDAAAQQLGLKQQVAYGLVKNQLLAARYDEHKGRRISQAQIRAFQDNYVSLAELAKQRGISPRKLLQSITVNPASGPMVDGSRQYFYRRADLVEPIYNTQNPSANQP